MFDEPQADFAIVGIRDNIYLRGSAQSILQSRKIVPTTHGIHPAMCAVIRKGRVNH